jgi:diguanylate cyclase (GGDEF)-like protein/PAS domain S-box-containing protein
MITTKSGFVLKTRERLALVLIVMATVPALLISGLAYTNARNTIQEEVKSKLNSAADLKSAEISRWINLIISDTHLLAVNFLNEEHITVILDLHADPELQSAFGNFLTENLLSLQQARLGYSEIFFVDRSGTIILSTDASRVGQNVGSTEVVAKTFAADTGQYIQDVHKNGENTEMAFGHVLRAVDLDNLITTDTVNAAVIIRVNLENSLYPIVQAWPAQGKTGEMLLIGSLDNQYTFISPLRFYENGILNSTVSMNFFPAELFSGSAGTTDEVGEFLDYRGITTLGAYRIIPETNWIFLTKLDRAEGFSSVDRLATVSIFIALGILIAATLLAAYLARNLTGPLEVLTRAARDVEAGNLNTEVKLHRSDEFGELSLAFNKMVNSVQENAAELLALVKFSGSLLSSSNTEMTLQNTLREALAAIHAEVGVVMLNTEDETGIIVKETVGLPRELLVDPIPLNALTVVGYSMMQGRSIALTNGSEKGKFQEDEFFRKFGLKTLMAVPMLIEEKSIGALILGTYDIREFSGREVNLAETIANQTALALERSKLMGNLSASYDQTLLALTAALDARDKETEGHSKRVVIYTAALAKKLGLSQNIIQEIKRGALLHDIGKIGVPDSILGKPGPLNDQEWAIMRNHPEWGEKILTRVPFLKFPADIVLAHQERWDGKGYPKGLKDKEIPIGARIFSVVDAFDAITSDRPYRKAQAYDAAREEILAGRGTQFDPEAVDAFLQFTPEDWTLMREQADIIPTQIDPQPNADNKGQDILLESGNQVRKAEITSKLSTRENAHALNTLFEQLPIPYASIGLEGKINIANKSFIDMLGYPIIQLAGKRIHDLCAAPVGQAICIQVFDRVRAGEEFPQAELELKKAKGGSLWVLMTAWPNFDKSINVAGIHFMFMDITQRKNTEEALEQSASRDALTQLFNRAHFSAKLKKMISRLQFDSGASSAILFIDLDNLKNVNDRFGHKAGDELLVEVARRLENSIRPGDLLCRWGGDEFAIYVTGITKETALQKVANRITGNFAKPLKLSGGHEIKISASLGRSLRKNVDFKFEEMMNEADQDMYRQKKETPNTR